MHWTCEQQNSMYMLFELRQRRGGTNAGSVHWFCSPAEGEPPEGVLSKAKQAHMTAG